MAKKEPIAALTFEQVRAALDYSPETGIFLWRHRPEVPARINKRFAGKPAGCSDGQYGYISIRLHTRLYQAHRLAWLYMTGEWPIHLVDHRDMNPKNNAWSNLRDATKAQNMMNQGIPSHNTSGFKGVTKNRLNGRWIAQIQLSGKNHVLGEFSTPEEADKVRREAAARLHGEFARFE